MGKFVSKTNLSYVWGKIKSLLGNKQDKITSSNKLSKDLVSGLGTASTVNTGTSNGNVPVIGTNGKLPSSVIPASAITDTFVASSQSAMLGLSSAEVGDVCVRTDLNKSFILKETPYSKLANWQELLTPTDAVTSVNGHTGAVSLTIPTGEAADKDVVTSVDTSANLPTSNAVKTFVEGKGYLTSIGNSNLPTRLQENSSSAVASADNAITQGWHYIGTSDSKKPPFKQVDGVTGNDYRIMTTSYGSTWYQQIATDFRSNDVFVRRMQNGTLQPWTALVKMQQGLTSPIGTDNALVRWDATRNATIQNSNAILDDTGNLSVAGTITEAGTALSDKYLGKKETAESATNATKLNNQSASYYLNYNNLSNKPTIPTTYIKSASQSTTSASQFIDVNGDRTTTTLTDASGGTKSITSWVYQNAVGDPTNVTTGGKAGLMSAADKNKLDSIDTSGLLKLDGSNTMTGVLNLKATGANETNIGANGIRWGTNSLPQDTAPQFICTIDAFAQGGRQKWTQLSDLKSALGVPTNTNQLTNGAGFVTSSALGTQATFSLSGTTLTITPK